MSFIYPLDIEEIFVNVFAGSFPIFLFLLVIFLTSMAARFRMTNLIFGTMLALLIVIMAQYMGPLYLLMLVVVSIIVFYTIARSVQ